MKAVAVLPGKPNSVHLREIPVPKLTDQPHPHVCRIPEGRAVLVKVLQSRRRCHRPRDQRGPLRQRPARAASISSSATRASGRSSRSGTR